MKKRDIINLVKESVKEMRSFYGVHDTYGASPRQTRNLSGYPGVMEEETFNAKDEYEDLNTSEREQVIANTPRGRKEDEAVMDYEDLKAKLGIEFDNAIKDYVMEDLKEFTDYGQEGRYPKKEKPGDMFRQKEVEDLFPNGMASRSDKAFQARVKQHADWTEQRAFNTTFVHMQYHETKGLEDEYFIYQTQHYNGNYDDFRNPKFTLLSITKNKDTENEENLGEYIVDTDAYVKDLETLRSRGVLGDRVMELFGMKPKPTQLPISAERIKKIFDAVNNSSRPEFFKNVFKGMYRIPFPENLKDINKDQALKMNMFMNDMKNKIRETVVVSKTTPPGDAADLAKSAGTTVDAVKTAIDQAKKTGDAVTVAELELTNDIGKDDYVDDEGRMAKSQLYKMAKYAVKLHSMLDDMEQLPAWVQAKFTKASDYLSSIYHYLDYEFARRDSDLMREMEKYKEAMLEEPNEISYDDAKKKGLKSPDKADISKDKDISDYELKRGMAIQKAIEKQK